MKKNMHLQNIKQFQNAQSGDIVKLTRDFKKWKLRNQINSWLEIGCGCKIDLFASALQPFKINVRGLDNNEYYKDLVRYSDKLDIGNCLELPYNDNQYDIVSSHDVLEHLDHTNIKKAFSEMLRCSGKYVSINPTTHTLEESIIFNPPSPNDPGGDDPTHKFIAHRNWWINFILENFHVSILNDLKVHDQILFRKL